MAMLAARDLQSFSELVLELHRRSAMFGEDMSNNVDKVLGFRAPKWLDEPLHARGIDRLKDSKEVIEAALQNTAREYQNRLAAKMEECAAAARVLGLVVVCDDAHAAAAAVRAGKVQLKQFFSHRHDPRGSL